MTGIIIRAISAGLFRTTQTASLWNNAPSCGRNPGRGARASGHTTAEPDKPVSAVEANRHARRTVICVGGQRRQHQEACQSEERGVGGVDFASTRGRDMSVAQTAR